MQLTHALARAVTASALAAIVTVGAVGPVHADNGKGTDRSAAAKSAAADRKAERGAEKDAKKDQRRNAAKPARAQGKPDTRASKQNPRGYGHTPVTVCHLRGNGTYIEITFDENALDPHTNHGDLYPVPAGGCPATADEGAGLEEEPDLEQPAVPGADDAPGAEVATDTEVAGVDAEAAAPVEDEVLGVQAEILGVQVEADATAGASAVAAAAGATGAPANAAAGILPNTGAGRFGPALLAGLGLLAAGAVTLARRRPQLSR